MQSAAVGSVLIATDPPGIVTDRDLRGRVLAAGLGSDTPASAVMSRPLVTLDSDRLAFTALRLMLDRNIHHLPLVEEGKVVGVISSSDLMLQQTSNPLYLRATIDGLTDPVKTRYADEVARVVRGLSRGGLAAAQIGQVVSGLNDALIRRLVVLAEGSLGPAPTPFAWIVFGSEGRLEQTLLTDQDNALVYGEAGTEAELYFSQLAERVVSSLIQVGFPRCPGGYMATQWHKPLDAWCQLFTNWVNVPEPRALLDAAIFFDFRPVAGALSLEALEAILLRAQKQKLFLAHLARTAVAFSPPLGVFNRLRSDRGTVDLKKGGIAPIVGLARVGGLAAGSRERSTLERLSVAGASGVLLDAESARDLADIFPLFLHLRLRRQLAALEDNTALDNSVNLAELSTLERRHLTEAFRLIKQTQEHITSAWDLNRLS
jgi:CBS domain-containing protein